MAKSSEYRQISLQEKLYRECDVMLKHATSKGLSVAPTLVRDFTAIDNRTPPLDALKVKHRDFLSRQDVKFNDADLYTLARIHQTLAKIVFPATPYTLLFIQTDGENKIGRWQIFGSVPLIRRMLMAAMISFILLIAFAFYPEARHVLESNITDVGRWDLVVAVVFLLAAAGLGASFYALYKVRSYVSNNTFDPSYEATYWTEFILGLMAGLILSNIINADEVSNATSDATNDIIILGKMTIALLGGFASNVVYEFLNRVVQALASIVKPESGKLIEAKIKEAKASVKEDLLERKNELTRNLLDMQSDLFSGKLKPKDIGDRLKYIVQDVVKEDEYVTPRQEVPQTTERVIVVPEEDVPNVNPFEPQASAEIDPNMVEHFHEDDINNATSDEYVDRV